MKEAEIPESKNLEYKGSLDFDDHRHKEKLLKTVCAFANTNGGLLIYGIDAKEGIPTELNGIFVDNNDNLGMQIANTIRDNSEPSIPSVQIEFRDKSESNNVFILIKVPRSWNLPHRVSITKKKIYKHFYIRGDFHNNLMDIFELKTAFNLSETLVEKINKFKNERIFSISSDNKIPFPLPSGSKTVIHLIPLNSFYVSQNYDFSQIINMNDYFELKPMVGTGFNPRINFDGFATYAGLVDGKTHSYTQLYRNGIIEAVSTELFSNKEKKISGVYHETKIVETIERYLKIYEKANVGLPILIFVTLIGMKDYTMYVDRSEATSFPRGFKIDRDILELPEAILQKYDDNVGNILKPCFDSIWNACGYEGSKNYNSEGEWDPK